MENVREYYKQCFSAERPTFLKVMRAVPQDQAGYKTPSTLVIGGRHLVAAGNRAPRCVRSHRPGEVNYVPTPSPGVGESIAAYEQHAAALESRLESLDDAKWNSQVRLLMDGKVAWETTLGDMLFGFLFDAVHHRGQLSSYLRPMGAKVPSIYGPSGDDPGT